MGMAIYAIAAMLALSALPAEHLHASAGGGTVHRHLVEDRAEHDSHVVSHGDHGAATTLEPSFDTPRPHAVAGPSTAWSVVLVAPMRPRGTVWPVDARLTHGPPIPFDSLPAPPA